MANVGVTFDFAAESAKLRSEIDKVRKELGALNATAKGIGDGFKALGGVIAAAFSVSALAGFLRSVNQSADALNDLSARMGASASGLQSLQVAASLAGGSAEAINTALGKMSATLGDAVNGNKQAVAAFNQLGLSVQQLAQLKPDEAFRLINQRLSEIPNSFQRAAAAQDIFGKGAKELAGLMAEGDAAIQAVNRKLEEQGAAIDDLDVAKIGVMNDELQFQQTVVTNLGTKFLSGLTPAVGVATNAVAEMLGRLGGASEAGKLFGTVMVATIKIVETAAYGLAATFETVRAVISGMLAIIADGVASVIGGMANAAEFFGLKIAEPLRNAATIMDNIGGALQNVSDTARENAVQAASYAIEAATEIVKAGEIFSAAEAEYGQKAAEALARNQANQGATSALPITAPEEKTKKLSRDDMLNAAAADPAAARLGQTPNPYEFGTMLTDDGKLDTLAKDPLTDPKYIYQQSLNSAMTQLASDQAATELALAQAHDASLLDSLLLRNDTMLAAEEYKNMTMGGMMDQLVQMGMQQGGVMGKFAKAYSIAQTIWSTGAAVMNAMRDVPYPANIGVAAMIAAKGAAQLANIKKTNIGSSGSVTAGSGSGSPGVTKSTPEGTQAASTESQQKSAVQVVVQGNVFSSQETVDWLAEKLGEAINNRDLVFINGNSRQAAELVAA